MKRRKFLSTGLKALATPLIIQGTPLKALSGFNFPVDPCDLKDDRAMVIIKLGGGNDGLHTFIPLSQYSRYATIRPTLKHSYSSLIELDKNLGQDYALGMHPKLTGFKNLYANSLTKSGTSVDTKVNMNVVNSVSYPNNSRSHFRSTDLMLKGLSGTATQDASKEKTSGWMARFLNSGYDPTKSLDPLGIQLGLTKPSLGFEHDEEHTISLNLSGQDLQGYYSLIENFNSAHVLDGVGKKELADMKENIDHILDIEGDMNTYADRITKVFNAGSNSTATYPNNSLASQLKTVARLVKGGCTTKIYLCHMGGFDTHSNQKSRHQNLMSTLDSAISSFYQDLVNMDIAEQVLTATFSEFGRKAVENGSGSGGTDHGTLAPMMIFGTGVVNGVTGKNPDLTNLTSKGQLQAQTGNPIQDYRRVFTTLIQDWLGASNNDLKETLFGDFGSKKLDLVQSSLRIPNSCYNGSGSSGKREFLRSGTKKVFESSVYPNPAIDHFNVSIKSNERSVVNMEIRTISGQLVEGSRISVKKGETLIRKEIGLRSGMYFVTLVTTKGEVIQKHSVLVR